MPALNFKERFIEKISSGQKRQTIRAKGKRIISKGQTLYLYTGLRTKKTKLLLKTICKSANDIEINQFAIIIQEDYFNSSRISLESELNAFAKKDGFESFLEMINFFNVHYTLPFKGILIKW